MDNNIQPYTFVLSLYIHFFESKILDIFVFGDYSKCYSLLFRAHIKKIIHIDMDAFFASVEQRDFPQYRGKPLVVGGKSRRGVVAAASYEARKYGIHSAMPGFIAKKKCPHLIFARSRFGVYKEVSQQINDIFHSYTDLVQAVSIDEAYLDVTDNKYGIESAAEVGRQIKKRILDTTRLTASAGVSFNKFLAKVASDYRKPDGITVVTPENAEKFLTNLPVKKIPGVGRVTQKKMEDMGIQTAGQLREFSEEYLRYHFGKIGSHYFRLVHLSSSDSVSPYHTRKSIGTERTFMDDVKDEQEMIEALTNITTELKRRMDKANVTGKTLTLKIKYSDFTILSRSRTILDYFLNENELLDIATELLRRPTLPVKPVRLLGLQLANLVDVSLDLFPYQMKFHFE